MVRKFKRKAQAKAYRRGSGEKHLKEIVSPSGCATRGLQEPSFRFAPVENNLTRFSRTRMSWESGSSSELLIFQVDIPRVREEARCNRGQVNFVSWHCEEYVKGLFCEQRRWHSEAASLQSHCAGILLGPQGNDIRTIDQIPVEAHANSEAVRFRSVFALGGQHRYTRPKQQGPETTED